MIYLAIFIGIYAYTQIRGYWKHEHAIKTEHYDIQSNTTAGLTDNIGKKLEKQFIAYSRIFKKQKKPGLFTIRIYKNRAEFKRVNPSPRWAEALYINPVCHFYIDKKKANPYHWGFHEATHQLNREYAGLKIPLWADEGLATLFGTGIIDKNDNLTRKTDPNTYPLWWINSLVLTDNIKQDIAKKQFIAIKDIVYAKRPININEHFNRYYIMWWSLTHYLFWEENRVHREAYLEFLQGKTTIDDFYKNVILANDIEKKIHNKLKKMQTSTVKPVKKKELFH